jgi:glycosyltransferase involved in cell wall biosynthesis
MKAEFPQIPDFRHNFLIKEPERTALPRPTGPALNALSQGAVGEGVVAGLSIVIPAWNEEDRLARTLERYVPSLEARGGPFEVIVVIDGVQDRTADVAAEFKDRHVRMLQFPTKLGKGGAILAGVQAARYENVGYLDADGPVPPEDVFALVESLSEFDCAVASRRIPGSRVLTQEPAIRRFASGVWGSLVRSILFLPIRDTQCGAKFFRRSALLPVLKAVAVTNWAFDVSLLYHLRESGRTILEQPVTWSHHTGSRMVVAKAMPIMFVSLVGLRLMNLSLARHIPPTWIDYFAQKLAAG